MVEQVYGCETRSEAACLNVQDEAWITVLRGDPPDQAWLDEANTLIVAGSATIRKGMDRAEETTIRDARERFFEEFLGWESPLHPLSKAYDQLKKAKPGLVPLATFVEAQRYLSGELKDAPKNGLNAVNFIKKAPEVIVLSRAGIAQKVDALREYELDALQVLLKLPNLFTVSKTTLTAHMNNLRDKGLDLKKISDVIPVALTYSESNIDEKLQALASAGLDAVAIINKHVTMISYSPDTIKRRLKMLERYAVTLGWHGKVNHLIGMYPGVLTQSDAKLRTHMRLFAMFGRQDMRVPEVQALLIEPLESQLLAVDAGLTAQNYTRRKVQTMVKGVSAKEKKKRVRSRLDEPEFHRHVGVQTVAAYRRYAKIV